MKRIFAIVCILSLVVCAILVASAEQPASADFSTDSGTITAVENGVKLSADGTYDWNKSFTFSKAVQVEGFTLDIADSNVASTAFESTGQGGLKIWLSSDSSKTNALYIEQHFNIFGNATGLIADTNGHTYLDSNTGALWSESGGVCGSDMKLTLNKNGDKYTLSISSQTAGKSSIGAAQRGFSVEIPAADINSLFSDGKVFVIISAYFQPTPGVVGTSELTVTNISPLVETNPSDVEDDDEDDDKDDDEEEPKNDVKYPNVSAKDFVVKGSGKLSDTANGAKLLSSGTYNYEEGMTFKYLTTLNGMEIKIKDMNLASTAWKKTGQGGMLICLTADGTASTSGILIDLAFNAFGNTTLYVKTNSGKELVSSNDGLFWKKVEGGVPVSDITVTLKKEGSKYILTFASDSYSYADKAPDVDFLSTSYELDAAEVDSLFTSNSGKTGFGIYPYFQETAGNVSESSITVCSIINPNVKDPRNEESNQPGNGNDGPGNSGNNPPTGENDNVLLIMMSVCIISLAGVIRNKRTCK